MKKLQVTRYQPPISTLPPVYVTYIPWRKMWKMVADYKVTYAGMTFEIPIDFEFDLSSVPRWLWPIVSSFELSIVAPLIHDYFFRFAGRPIYHTPIKQVTRLQANQIFYDMMILEGVPKWKASAAYHAVQTFASRW
jgi:hypothetical protein